MRKDSERRKQGGQLGHRGAGRELKPSDQMDEIVDHYPGACGGCGRAFDPAQRRSGGRFGRHQVAELPAISVVFSEHRTHQLRCRHCRARTSATLPEEIGSSPFGSRLQAALVTLTAAYRISRRGVSELARDLFGVTLSTGTADAICQRASEALAGPHLHLGDQVLVAPAVHVDETGWRTKGDARALWTANTPSAVFLQIAEHCNREVFDALIGTTYPGIVVSDRWNGYSHLDPTRRQVCWSHLQRDFRRHADGLGEQKPFGERGLELTGRVFAAWRAYQHKHQDRRPTPSRDRADPERTPATARRRLAEEQAHPLAPQVRQQPAQGLARALDLRDHRRRRADQQSRRTRAPRCGHPPESLARHARRKRRAVRRTRPIGRGDLPTATPLAIHLSQRPHRGSQPRRPVPRARLNPAAPRTERLLKCPPEQGFCSSRSGRLRACQEVTHMVHDGADVPAGPASLDSVHVRFDEQRLVSDAGLLIDSDARRAARDRGDGERVGVA